MSIPANATSTPTLTRRIGTGPGPPRRDVPSRRSWDVMASGGHSSEMSDM